MEGEASTLGPYVAGIMDTLKVQPKQVAVLSGEAAATVSRLRTGSRSVNQRQFCQILVAIGRAIELNRIEPNRQTAKK